MTSTFFGLNRTESRRASERRQQVRSIRHARKRKEDAELEAHPELRDTKVFRSVRRRSEDRGHASL